MKPYNWKIRGDSNAVAVSGWIVGLIGVLIAILVGIVLIKPMNDAINNTTNCNIGQGLNVNCTPTFTNSSAAASLLGLIPLLVVIAIVLVVVYWAIQRYSGAE